MPRKTRRSTRRNTRRRVGGSILDGIAEFFFGSEKKNTVPTSNSANYPGPSANVVASVPSTHEPTTMGGKRKARKSRKAMKSRKSRKAMKSRKASRKH